jgi:hypothetical protein
LKSAEFTDPGSFSAEFKVWPNPSVDYFTVDLTSISVQKIELSVYNALGQLIMVPAYNGSGIVRFGNELKPGEYFLAVKYDSRQEVVRLLKK